MKARRTVPMFNSAAAAMRPLDRRIRTLATRSTITRADDSELAQNVQVTALALERIPESNRVQMFGLTANPPAGSTALLISIGGSRTHCVVIGADHESRPRDLLPGEAQHYNQWGDFVYLQENGEAHVKARSKVFSDAPLTHALGDVEVDGDMLVHGNVVIEGDTTIEKTLTVEQTTALIGAVTAQATFHAIGAISSATSIADPYSTMQAIRVTFNLHYHDGADGPVTNPPTTTMP